MFEVIPQKCNRYYRDLLRQINAGENVSCDVNFVKTQARLEQLEESFRISIKNVNNKFVFMGSILSSIESEALYSSVSIKNSCCKDIYKYANFRFGLNKTTTFNLISIANTFATYGDLLPKWKDFSYSQLCEMLSMSEQDREKVKPNMTVKQIRELKNSLPFLNSEEIQTSEFSVEDNEELIKDAIKKQRIEKLAKLLEDGDAFHLWDNGKKDFNEFAKFLLDNGVSIKL